LNQERFYKFSEDKTLINSFSENSEDVKKQIASEKLRKNVSSTYILKQLMSQRATFMPQMN
jgi:hypothetical protein